MSGQPWIHTVSGLPVDLVAPCASQVDFEEIAHALSRINRYVGHARDAVSVGLHTLIGLDLCDRAGRPDLRPHWLLHDAHEARLGDWATPVVKALAAVAAEMFDGTFAEQMTRVHQVLADRHDAVIHRAAGLALPNPADREVLRTIDLTALATERRDFLATMPRAVRRPWVIDTLGIEPGPKVWRVLPAADVGISLLAAFRTHLPALRTGRAA